MKSCPVCNKPVIGRTDKKYCSDLCRNSHNNDSLIEIRSKVNQVHTILRRNRRILEELIGLNIRKVSKEKLLRQGLNFYYVTSFEYDKDRNFRYMCYEYGYYAVGNDCYKLVKQVDNKRH
ncbi:MAG: hypothetical protein JWO44_200 [Bacteroidetes bacterium]|nr:hypothetical protein [Bacteroidota bacterium]